MSIGGSKGSSQNQSQSTSNSYLDPQIENLLAQNYGQAQNLVDNSSYKPLSASEISNYENPYTSEVVGTTNQELQQQNQIANQANQESATTQGAFGGDRASVLQALTNLGYSQAEAQADAGLNAQGYQNATTTAQTENTNQNQYPLLLQALLNSTAGLFGNPVLNTAQSTASGSADQIGLNFAAKAG